MDNIQQSEFECGVHRGMGELDKPVGMVGFGKCTWRYAMVDGVKTDICDAKKGCIGFCPICGDVLVPRKGERREWHWWHRRGRKCDVWYEPKGEWHRWWQDNFVKEWQENVLSKVSDGEITKHIADIHTVDKWTIEFQYSHLSPVDIREREQFYGNMIWVVNGTRLSTVKIKGEKLLNGVDFYETKKGLRYFRVDMYDEISEDWWNRDKLVFFDFFGTFESPMPGKDLLCLIPGDIHGSRLVVRLCQSEFLARVTNGHVGDFVEDIMECRLDYTARVTAERMQREKDEAERCIQERKEFLKKCEEDYQIDLRSPALYAVTCNWVEGVLVKCGIVNSLIRKWNLLDIPQSGKMALHLTNHYTVSEYWNEIRTAKEILHGARIPKYEELQKCAGMVIAKIQYETFYCANAREWKLMIEDVEPLVNFEEMERCVCNVENRSGNDVWRLPDDLAELINDRKSVDRRKPKCPRCGADMLLRHRRTDNGPFYGCSEYPKCKCALSCNEHEQINVGYVYKLSYSW